MKTVVMKFGGSSVADVQKVQNVARRVVEKKKAKNHVVVVVSAPGDMTDDLIEKAHQLCESPSEREMDMLLSTGEQVSIALLSMAIHHLKAGAVSLTGPQAGIYADHNHTRAKITKILPDKIQEELRKGNVVIVAGFQGINPNQDIATLGRGGSDLTAVALAAALKADACEIYTDVSGVYTTDPRIVPEARKLDKISYDEMLEMAGAGSQVMQARSIEVAKKYGVELQVRSTFLKEEGTWIIEEVKGMEDVIVSSIAFDKNQSKLTVLGVEDRPGIAARIFGELAEAHINVDMIIQSAAQDRTNDISFTIARTDLKKALSILKEVGKELKSQGISCEEKVAKVSIVGVGMKSHAGVAAKMFKTLSDEKINIEMISTSEIKVACVVKEFECQQAVKALHKAFELHKK